MTFFDSSSSFSSPLPSAFPTSSILLHNYDYFEDDNDKVVEIKTRMHKDFRHIVDKSGIIKGTQNKKDIDAHWNTTPTKDYIISHDIRSAKLWARETNETYSNAFKKSRKTNDPLATNGEEKEPPRNGSTCTCRSEIKSLDFEFDCFKDNTINYQETKPQKLIKQNFWETKKFNMDEPSILGAFSLQDFQRAIFQHNQERFKYFEHIPTCQYDNTYCGRSGELFRETMNILKCVAIPLSSSKQNRQWKKFKKCMNKPSFYELQSTFEYELVAWTSRSIERRADMIIYKLYAVLNPVVSNNESNDDVKRNSVKIPVFEILYTRPKCQDQQSLTCGVQGPDHTDFRPRNKLVLKHMKKRQTKERIYDRSQKFKPLIFDPSR